MSAPFPVVIFHNPDCSTSRRALELIEAAGHLPEVIEYLKTGWTRGQLLALFAAANLSVRDALREKEAGAHPGLMDAGDEAILAAMVEHAVLVQRPFVATPKGVRLCRPKADLVNVLL